MGHDHQEFIPSNCSILSVLFTHLPEAATATVVLNQILVDTGDLQVSEPPIGEGSSAVVRQGVYKGIHKVAVKELKGAFVKGSKTQAEFRREALSLISCAHKNILKLYGVCLSPTHGICIVTKFMQGGSLSDYLVKKKCLPTAEVIKLAKDVATGMRFLHSKGILHMDLKTANVLLDEEGSAVIGDLGIARVKDEKDDERPEIGTYQYMAPEVCAGALLDSKGGDMDWFTYKSDVYSFGILLWELVTCELPYADYNPVQAAVGVMMHGLRPAIPASAYPPLRCLMQKCWHQNPSCRPDFSQVVQMLHIINSHEKTYTM
ncbi:hypothetical protein KP509_30G003700 [Ceratopteris richardii]|uniref:Protein kinase domain-containing protein n=1 Tax=Ceratopteris richardii TaxID=49495 RepID=A0A8T2QZE0_CERRI|nr:hypothetical protein KP509_30G003700 [Ceratopteris richardii]